MKRFDENTELLIELIQGALEEEGYQAKRHSNSDNHLTTSYDCIEVKGYDGNYYCISIDKREDRQNPNTGQIERKNEAFDSI